MKVRITVESQDEGASKTVDAIARVVRDSLPGQVTGEDGAINHRAIYLDVDEDAAIDASIPESGSIEP